MTAVPCPAACNGSCALPGAVCARTCLLPAAPRHRWCCTRSRAGTVPASPWPTARASGPLPRWPGWEPTGTPCGPWAATASRYRAAPPPRWRCRRCRATCNSRAAANGRASACASRGRPAPHPSARARCRICSTSSGGAMAHAPLSRWVNPGIRMTNLTKHRLHFAITTIAASALLASASGTINAQTAIDTGTGPGTASVRPGEPVTLNFANADIEAVARTMATITGRNVVVDPRVKGQLNLVTERAVTPAAAFQQFLAALRLQGFTVVEAAGLYKVVPEADAKLQGGSVSVAQPGSAGPAGGQIVTQIYKLNYESASNLVPVLRPLISPNNTINVNPGTRLLALS